MKIHSSHCKILATINFELQFLIQKKLKVKIEADNNNNQNERYENDSNQQNGKQRSKTYNKNTNISTHRNCPSSYILTKIDAIHFCVCQSVTSTKEYFRKLKTKVYSLFKNWGE